MKTFKTIAAAALLTASSIALTAGADDSLEPCINGGVSALGMHASQAQEDTSKIAKVSEMELEPCINGGVSASGTYPTQALEDQQRFGESSVAGIGEEPKAF